MLIYRPGENCFNNILLQKDAAGRLMFDSGVVNTMIVNNRFRPSHSLSQSIKTNLYSAMRRKRITGAYRQTVYVHYMYMQYRTVQFLRFSFYRASAH